MLLICPIKEIASPEVSLDFHQEKNDKVRHCFVVFMLVFFSFQSKVSGTLPFHHSLVMLIRVHLKSTEVIKRLLLVDTKKSFCTL